MKSRAPFCVRHAAADTFAMVVFCFVAGMLIEIFLSGMSFEQSLASRLVSIPVNIAIAWPFGLYRDWILTLGLRLPLPLRVDRSLRDIVAYVSFQTPVYIAILYAVGASHEQVAMAAITNAFVSCGMGFVYGYFLDLCRRWFRVPGYFQGPTFHG
jgi:hypothetical protein